MLSASTEETGDALVVVESLAGGLPRCLGAHTDAAEHG
jgi:hypothetical protein